MESLISAAVGSFGVVAPVAASVVGVARVLSSSDIVKLYYSSLLRSVSAAGVSIARQQVQGPIWIDKDSRALEFDYDFTNVRDDGKQHYRGNQPYERPYGSYHIESL